MFVHYFHHIFVVVGHLAERGLRCCRTWVLIDYDCVWLVPLHWNGSNCCVHAFILYHKMAAHAPVSIVEEPDTANGKCTFVGADPPVRLPGLLPQTQLLKEGWSICNSTKEIKNGYLSHLAPIDQTNRNGG